jgi:hypothetical protein
MWRTGAYGTTVWHHRLDCGHVEARKRRAPAGEIGCLRCEARQQVEAETPATAITTSPEATLGTDVAILRAHLASRLGVPVDSVTIQIALDKVAGALIFLEPKQIIEIIGD